MESPMTSRFEAGLASIRQSPKDEGVLELIVRRPQSEAREVLAQGMLVPAEGLVGDSWRARCVARGTQDSPGFETQLTLMNSRAIGLFAGDKEGWPPAGDQLFVDLDLSGENLPPGTQLSMGEAVLEITAQPHTGCRKFSARFGADALKFVNSPKGRRLNLRGIYAKVVRGGTIRAGDRITVVRSA